MLNLNDFAVPCAIGTYYEKVTKTCIPCPQGTYQSESGQLQCLPCPIIAGRSGVTIGLGARSAADCKGKLASIRYGNQVSLFSDLKNFNNYSQNEVQCSLENNKKVQIYRGNLIYLCSE